MAICDHSLFPFFFGCGIGLSIEVPYRRSNGLGWVRAGIWVVSQERLDFYFHSSPSSQDLGQAYAGSGASWILFFSGYGGIG